MGASPDTAPRFGRRAFVLGAGLALAGCALPAGRGAPRTTTCDVLVVGATPAGIVCAIEAAGRGARVVLLERSRVVGGLCSAGLGFSDTGRKEVVGGRAREFFQRLWRHYADDAAWRHEARSDFGNRGQGTPALDGENRTMWLFEPSVARAVFEAWLAEAPHARNLVVERGVALDRTRAPLRRGSAVTGVFALDGRCFAAGVYVDATYEGDLLALAGAPFTVGREGRDVYGEELAGVQTARAVKNQFPPGVDPFVLPGRADSGLLPGVVEALPPDGTGDLGVQAYCFRLALSDVPSNRVPIEPPTDLDERDHELLVRSIAAGQSRNFLTLDLLPNRKTDSNNWGGASSDFVGANHAYPLASDEERARIVDAHARWQRGHLWTLAHDPRVPREIRDVYAPWGLAADEHVENGHWPHALYVREARRMVSDVVATEHEVRGRAPVTRPIAMGSYAIDSHNVWRHVGAQGDVRNEGDVQVPLAAPYAIDLGVILPPAAGPSNLVVPVCVSASHVAYGSIRMEPVFMSLGQAAGLVAVQALERGRAVTECDYAVLRTQLEDGGAVLAAPA
jgi:hypothetical protein